MSENERHLCNFCGEREATDMYSPDAPITLSICKTCLDMIPMRTWHNLNHTWSLRPGLNAILHNKNLYSQENWHNGRPVHVYWKGEYIEMEEYCKTISEERLREQYSDDNEYTKKLLDKYLTKLAQDND